MAAALRARFSRVPKERPRSNTAGHGQPKNKAGTDSEKQPTSVSTNRGTKKATEQPRSHVVSHGEKKKNVTSGGELVTKELLSPAALQMYKQTH